MVFVPHTVEELRAGFPPQVDHLSASQITQILRCPEQWRRTRLHGEKARPGKAAIWGNADHHAIELHFKKVLETGDPDGGLSVSDVQDAFVTHFDERVAEEGWDGIDWNGQPGKVAGMIKDNGAYLAGLYREQVAPWVIPTAVEVEFAVEQPHWPVPVLGRIDVETTDRIIERKSTSRTESRPKGDWLAQGRIYQMVLPKTLAWHQSVRNENNKLRQASYGETAAFTVDVGSPQRQAMADRMVVQAVETIRHLYTTFGPDEVWPGATTHPWACGYCSLANTCPWLAA